MNATGRVSLAVLFAALLIFVAGKLGANSVPSEERITELDVSYATPPAWGEDYAVSTQPAHANMVYPRNQELSKSQMEEAALYFGYAGKVLLIVQASLYDSISTSLATYREDLEREGYTVAFPRKSGRLVKTHG